MKKLLGMIYGLAAGRKCEFALAVVEWHQRRWQREIEQIQWSRVVTELTLESLAGRLADLERKLAERPQVSDQPVHDWRSIVGMMEDNEFTREWIAEMEAIREADREAARQGQPEAKP